MMQAGSNSALSAYRASPETLPDPFFGPGRLRCHDTVRIEVRGGSMIRHAAAAAFPVGPLPVAVIEPSLPALPVPPVGGSQLWPPCFPPASVAAVSVAPVTMTADPEHRATADTPAKPLAQGLFAGPHRRPSGGTGQPRLGLAGVILSTEDVRSFFGSAQKTRSLLRVGVFPFRLRPNHAPDRVSLAWRRLSLALP